MRILTAIAVALLLAGGFLVPQMADASGSAAISQISNPIDLVSGTVRSQEVTGNIGIIALAFLGILLIAGHFGGAFVPLFVGLIGLGFWFGAPEIISTFGWTAVGL